MAVVVTGNVNLKVRLEVELLFGHSVQINVQNFASVRYDLVPIARVHQWLDQGQLLDA